MIGLVALIALMSSDGSAGDLRPGDVAHTANLLPGTPAQANGFISKIWNARKADVEKELGRDPKAEKSGQYGYTVHFTGYRGPKLAKSLPHATSLEFTYWWKDPRVTFIDVTFKTGTTIETARKEVGLASASVSSPYHDGGKPGDDSAHEAFLRENYLSDPKAFQKSQPEWTSYRSYDVTKHGLKNAKVFFRVRECLDKDAKIVDKEILLTVGTSHKK